MHTGQQPIFPKARGTLLKKAYLGPTKGNEITTPQSFPTTDIYFRLPENKLELSEVRLKSGIILTADMVF